MLLDQLKDYIIGSIFDLGKDTLVKRHEKKQLVSLIEDYLSREAAFNDVATQVEEIDYEGFCSFVSSDTFRRLMVQRIDGNTDERGRARDSIWKQATEYAHADTKDAKRNVAKLITDISDIIQDFFVFQLGHGEHILAARIEDRINDAHADLTSRMDRIENKTNTTLDCFAELVRNRDMKGAASVIDSFLKVADSYHDLKEYYRFAPMTVGDHISFYSVPLSQEALQKYPPNLRVEEEILVSGQKMSRDKAIEYSINHQVPINVRIKNATAYLGSEVDPAQGPAEVVVGTAYDVVPPPLSAVYNCRIVVDDTICYPHIELCITEKMDDGVGVFSNTKQKDRDVLIEFRYKEDRLVETHFEIKNGTTKQILDFDRFAKLAKDGAKVDIIDNETNLSVASWIQEKELAESQFGTIDDEIDFLERILCIENHFKIQMNIKTISQQDYKLLCFLSDLISGKKCEGEWETFNIELKITDHLKELFSNSNGEFGALYGPAEIEEELFGETLNLRFFRLMSKARIIDFDRKKKQVELADLDETVKLKETLI